MKNKSIFKKFLALALAVLMIVFTFAACGKADTNSEDNSAAKKNITVTVTFEDKTEKVFNIKTSRKYLGDALFDEGLVTEEEYKSGFYSYIDGVRADYSKDGSWWCLTKGGNEVMTGFNKTTISDGDQFEITNTPA